MTKPLRHLVDKVLMRVANFAASFPKNDYFYCYTINNGTTNYLTRVLFPRVFGMRPMLHKIWRQDLDREAHNHPWSKSYSFILIGSYVEERVDLTVEALYRTLKISKAPMFIKQHVKWFNHLYKEDFHRITEIDGPLWTLFIAGTRQKDENGVEWGFLDEVTRKLIPHDEYTAWSGAKRV